MGNVPNPSNPSQYFACLPDGEYFVMNCPAGLVFNKYLDRCDYNANPISPCVSSPCQNGGHCVELVNYQYQCQCYQGYSGSHCELDQSGTHRSASSACLSNPCGPQGVCNSMAPNSPIPYYCTCSNEAYFGTNCNYANEEANPCLLYNNYPNQEAFFTTRISPSLFVHCNGPKLYLQVCPKPLVFSVVLKRCERTVYGSQEKSQSTYSPSYYNYGKK